MKTISFRTMKTISFREDMIDLILAGKKTLTIRPIKPQPVRVEKPGLFGKTCYEWEGRELYWNQEWFLKQCPYGLIGETICVRENGSLRLKIIGKDAKRIDQTTIKEWTADGVEGMRSFGRATSIWDRRAWNHWQSFYGGTDYDWLRRPFVWVIRFEVQP